MRKFIVLPLLVLLAACTDDGVIMPVGPDGPLFAKKCSSPPCDKGGGGGGDADGEYTITDLGTLPGNISSRGSGINVNGGKIQLVGMSGGGEAGLEVATRWTVDSDGIVTEVDSLEMPVGTKYAWALAITETGIAVGQSGFRPVYWDANGSINSLLLGDNVTRGRANDVSLVDGEVFIVGQQRTTPAQAVYWVGSSFELQPLPIFEDGAHASAQAVNSQGTIAARSTGHAVVWHPDANGDYQVCDLGLNSIAFGISELNTEGLVHVAGAYPTTDYFATVWTVDLDATLWEQPAKPCAVTNVRSLDFFSEFVDVNAQGDAVGDDIGKHKAILWPEGNALVYLPSLTNRGSSGANAISADGKYIAGRSRTKRSTRAVLWTRKD